MIEDLLLLQVIGVGAGVAGQVAITDPDNKSIRVRAWQLWIISNIALIAWSNYADEPLLLVLYGVYLIFSTVGLIRLRRVKP